MSTTAKLRCAVYTRKSSEEGLDQAFNSLDAQREACVAFIRSQASLGWKLFAEQYDDGGISGGTMERPALQRLLQQIRERRIDVIVVYKIDRLTRSLMDFARMVEIFDGHAVSFVSVTQQFNTTTSMGRLTLNVLLSFAQFEREVTAERIRDKVAASKKKGIWMGGRVPYGYRAEDRKLIIDPDEADIVRSIFARYLALRSVSHLKSELDRQTSQASVASSCGKLAYLLANPIYIGKVRHQGQLHDGEHEPIVDHAIFEEAQALLAGRAPMHKGRALTPDIHLLTGRLFDEAGERLQPVHTSNHGKRYRYYVSKPTTQSLDGKGSAWRIAAGELEAAVEAQLDPLLTDAPRMMAWMQSVLPAHGMSDGLRAAGSLAADLNGTNGSERRRVIIRSVFRRITIAASEMRIKIDVPRLMQIILDRDDGSNDDENTLGAPVRNVSIGDDDDASPSSYVITVPIHFKQRGVETRLVIDGTNPVAPMVDDTLVSMLATAHLCLKALTDGSAPSIQAAAVMFDIDAADVSRILPLAFLSPEITQAILTGRQPIDLTLRKLTRMVDLPIVWSEQATALMH